MATKKNKPRPKLRNAGPRAPRAGHKPEEETPGQRIAYTAAGAAGTALVGAFLARQNWKPKTIATVLTAVGSGLAWRGDTPTIRSIGAGTMAASGGQLALQVIDDRYEQTLRKLPPEKKPANANDLPAGALEAAFERARAHMGLTVDPYPIDEAA